MKNNKIWTIISIVVLFLQAVAEGLAAAILLRLNLLPTKYTLLLAIVLVLLLAITGVLFFVHGKKPASTARRIVAMVLAVLIMIGCGLAFKVAFDAYNAIKAVTNEKPITNTMEMYVFVRNDDPAQSLADTAEYSFAIIADYDVDHTQQAIGKIQQAIGKMPVIAQYEMSSAIADALLGGQIDAAILNGASVALLLEQEGYENFTSKARILHAMALVDLEETEPTTEATITQEENITNTPFVVYISGSDTRNQKLRRSRSDVNILVIVNPVTKQILLLNTPRDYYVPNPAGKGKLDKLTHCGLYGVNCSMEALGDLYGVKVDHHAQINFTGLETLVDAVGGITVNSTQAFSAAGGSVKIQKGENYLNGEQALAFARERHHVSGGDNGRGKNQMQVIKALIKKITTGTTIISNYTQILDSLKGMFKTDVTMEQISMLVKMQLNDMASWNVQTFAVTGKGASKPSYSSPGHNAYVMYPNKKVVAYASELVNRVLAGETLTDKDMKVPQ